jgi:phenylalanyl-tRNA synthetase beta chain
MAADIIEEIVRVHGFKHIPSTPLPLKRRDTSLPLEMKRLGLMRRTLAARGLSEVHSWSFIQHDTAKKFGGGADELRLLNPISSDLDSMRPSIMPALLDMARRNHERGMSQTGLFETGYIYGWQNDAATQQSAACGVRSGAAVTTNPHSKDREVNLFDVKADAIAALEAVGAPVTGLQTVREAPAWYHPGKSGVLKLVKNIIACFGEIHPQLLADMDIKFAVAGFEILPDALPAPKTKSRTRAAYAPSQLMPLSRDYSFLLPQDALTSALVKAMAGAEKNLISNVEVISIYQDAKLAEHGKNSVAVRVTIQPTENALTDADINKISAAVIKNALTVSGCELSESINAYIKEKNLAI